MGLFEHSDQSPCRRLDQARMKLDCDGSTNDYINRCILLFVAHEIDARRNGSRASAIDWYCAQTEQRQEDVKSQIRRSAKYEQIVMKAGPGIILLLGDAVRDLCATPMTNQSWLRLTKMTGGKDR